MNSNNVVNLKRINWHHEKYKNWTGKKFGRWTIIGMTEEIHDWEGLIFSVQCVCGNQKEIARRYLTRGQSKSCGCLLNDKRIFPTALSIAREGHKTPPNSAPGGE